MMKQVEKQMEQARQGVDGLEKRLTLFFKTEKVAEQLAQFPATEQKDTSNYHM